MPPNVQHPMVHAHVSELRLYNARCIFPSARYESDALALTASDYNVFLRLLDEKYRQSTLDDLTINCHHIEALQGVMEYSKTTLPLPFKTLILNLKPPLRLDEGGMDALKELLSGLSTHPTIELKFIDDENRLSGAVEQLVEWIVENENITLDIVLPPLFSTSTQQYRMDEMLSHRIREKKIAATPSKLDPWIEPTIDKPIRTRSRQLASMTMDIELQQEQQAEMATAIATTRGMDASDQLEADESDSFYTHQGLLYAFNAGDLSDDSTSYRIPNSDELSACWLRWIGNTSNDIRLLKKACETLLRYPDAFQYGLDLNRLPAGFSLSKDSNLTLIRFDESLKRTCLPDPLTVQFSDLSAPPPLTYQQVEAWYQSEAPDNPVKAAWDKIRQSPYNREAYRVFSRYLPDLLSIAHSSVGQLFACCLFDSGLDSEKFEFLMRERHHPHALFIRDRCRSTKPSYLESFFGNKARDARNFFTWYEEKPINIQQLIGAPIFSRLLDEAHQPQLLRLYLEYGEKGLRVLETFIKKDGDLFNQLNRFIFKKTSGYSAVMDEGFHSAIDAIKGLTTNEKIWWDTLLEQHSRAHESINIIDLINAFKRFKEELRRIPLPEGTFLTFPPTCELENVRSMPVALSRILTLLCHTKPVNRQMQWEEASKLDLSSTGMIQAVASSAPRWAFITSEMGLGCPSREQVAARSGQNGARGSEMDIYNLRNGEYFFPRTAAFIYDQKDSEDPNPVLPFFRYVATQGSQLPMDFYKTVHVRLAESGLSPKCRASLYRLIAAATTGSQNTTQIEVMGKNSTENVITLIDSFRTKIPALLPPAIKERIRVSILDSLLDLEDTPSLPILTALVTIIVSNLDLKNMPQLVEANNKLRMYVTTYKGSVYDGMKHYSPDDYTEATLFYDHMDVIETIHTEVCNNTQLSTDFLYSEAFNRGAGLLIKLISTFHLTRADVAGLIEFIPSQNALLALLDNIQHKPAFARPLGAADLKAILTNSKKWDGKDLFSFIKSTDLDEDVPLINYFSKDFLEGHNTRLSRSIIEWVSRQFPGHVEDIKGLLLSFSKLGDSAYYPSLITQLQTVCAPLNDHQKKQFLTKLGATKGLYTDNDALSAEHPFIKLLEAIADKHAIEDFLNFVAAKHSPDATSLTKKALLFINVFSPTLIQKKNNPLSQLELMPRVLDVLVKTPDEELDKTSPIVPEETIYFNKAIEALSTAKEQMAEKKPPDFESLLHCIEPLISKELVEERGALGRIVKQCGMEHTQMSPEDAFRLAMNKPCQLIITYLNDPNRMNRMDRSKIEQNKKLKAVLEGHPGIKENEHLLPLLFSNARFQKASQGRSVIDAASSPDLLENEAHLEALAGALDSDLNALAAFNDDLIKMVSSLTEQRDDLRRYKHVFVALFKQVMAISATHSHSKKQFLALFDRYVDAYTGAGEEALLTYLTSFTQKLEEAFGTITDKNTVLALCLQFNSKKYQPKDLITLFEFLNKAPEAQRVILLNMAISLINNEKDFDLAAFGDLCQRMTGESRLGEALTICYTSPPFPTMAQVIGWHDTYQGSNDTDYRTSMSNLYEAYDKSPCARDGQNGFHIAKAEKQLEQLHGMEEGLIDCEAFSTYATTIRTQSSKDLLLLFKSIKDQNPINYSQLVALAAELLYRSKGTDGRSMEINTTQYLALLSMLETQGHVTSEIGTGEGKSRIMMIANACQFALGKTVDFVTSDVQLATRDYVEYLPYFKMIGAPTSIIYADSEPESYIKGGINFSDPANLSLFRNKARSMAKEDLVIDTTPQNRALLLDEADKTYFDFADMRFNFSTDSDESIQNMEWVYPLLMNYFFEKPDALDSFYNNVDKCREDFLRYAASNCSPQQQNRLNALSEKQIEAWQASAVAAGKLKFQEDFVIESGVLINTPSGAKMASTAYLIVSNRVATQSKLSFGMHQCLHARLNIARQRRDRESDPQLIEALAAVDQPFDVLDPKQIVYSSSSNDFLNDYAQGTLKGVTGTSGSLIEREEARQLRGGAGTPMHFIDVPRHEGLKRWDKSIRLVATEKKQLDTLIEQIEEAQLKNQPILIIAENDRESAELYKNLSKVFTTGIQHISSNTRAEASQIKQAGKARQITISTDMIGRGTDISLDEQCKEHGLHVMLTYLPRPRDLAQIIGRSARNGAAGESSMVLDKSRLKARLNQNTLRHGFYTQTEAYIAKEQARMDKKEQSKRLIKNTVYDFRTTLTDNFFKDLLPTLQKEDQKKAISLWLTFYDKSDKVWNEVRPLIEGAVIDKPTNIGSIKSHLTSYRAETLLLWTEFKEAIHQAGLRSDSRSAADLLRQDLDELTLNKKTLALLRASATKTISKAPRVFERYDKGHDGRSVVYKHWYTPVIASLKGFANIIPFVHFTDARVPFANTRAWLDDRGQLFTGFRSNKHKGKLAGSLLLGLIVAAVGGALLFTGILAPLGIAVLGLNAFVTSSVIAGVAGFAVGSVLGLAGGAVVDWVMNRDPESTEDTASYSEDELEPEPAGILESIGGKAMPNQTSAVDNEDTASYSEDELEPEPAGILESIGGKAMPNQTSAVDNEDTASYSEDELEPEPAGILESIGGKAMPNQTSTVDNKVGGASDKSFYGVLTGMSPRRSPANKKPDVGKPSNTEEGSPMQKP